MTRGHGIKNFIKLGCGIGNFFTCGHGVGNFFTREQSIGNFQHQKLIKPKDFRNNEFELETQEQKPKNLRTKELIFGLNYHPKTENLKYDPK